MSAVSLVLLLGVGWLVVGIALWRLVGELERLDHALASRGRSGAGWSGRGG